MLVLLDLGNVLYRIDFKRTILAISSLPGYNGVPIMFGVDEQDQMFVEFDKGLMTPSDFYNQLRTKYGVVASDAKLEKAWCTILIAPYPFAAQVPQQIREVYSSHTDQLRVAILSNISEPHLAKCQRDFPLLALPQHYGVDEAYYSCKLGKRKPDAEIFMEVCKRERTRPQDVVLYDDSAANVASARALGMRAVLVTPGDSDLAFREPW